MNPLATLVLALFTAVPTGQAIDQQLPVGGTTQVDGLQLQQSGACQPSWLPTFGGHSGTWNTGSLVVFDDGSGPALYAGGLFATAGGVPANSVAKWDGSSWSGLGSGIPGGTVQALAVFDDGGGSGPALFAAGAFTNAGGGSANRIAKWDGASWVPLGSGLNYWARTLAVFDDGAGPALYVGGRFWDAGGIAAYAVAKWDGTSWSPVGIGMPFGFTVSALTVFDDGGGSALYAGGNFVLAGGVPANRIAKWDGTNWSALGSGVNDEVLALTVFDDGSGGGPALYAGGEFGAAGGASAVRVAKWDGANWSALGSGLNCCRVLALAAFDDGGGPVLYVGGEFTSAGGVSANALAKWDGASWSPLGSALTGFSTGPPEVFALTVFDDGSGAGPALYAGGRFVSAGAQRANGIAKWDGSSWSPLPPEGGLDSYANALEVFDDGLGGGRALYAAGFFGSAGGIPAIGIAKWDGTSWSPLGSGINGGGYALTVFDDGSGAGPALYVGGDFTIAGGVDANYIAKWDGTSWSPLGKGMDKRVEALAVFDDGGGPALYAGGRLTSAGKLAANHIAKWDGVSWSPLGIGMSTTNAGYVYALTVFDDGLGGGPALCAGGRFASAGGISASRIAKWNGASWSPVGSGMSSDVNALTVFDDGGGPALYAGGSFGIAGGVLANSIAKWDGASWSPVGSGMNNPVNALAVRDDGGGTTLYAGGDFSTAGGVAVGKIAEWDGSSWSALGSGTIGGSNAQFLALTVFDDGLGGGSALYAGGSFGASTAGDSYLAKWGCPLPEPTPYCSAKGNSCGTLPTMLFLGASSASSATGFRVGCVNTRGGKAGLLLYSNVGQATTPFSGGILCLATPPLKRSPPKTDTTGTPGQCNGTLSMDLNEFAAGLGGGNPAAFLSQAGTPINIQWWGRDTVANGAMLTNALAYVVGP